MEFSTTMFQDGNNTGIEVPAEVVEALGAGKRPPVVVTVNGYSYRSTVAPMGGKYLLPFSAERRSESGISGGDAIDVEVVLDSAPRVVDVPEDLQAALDGVTGRGGGMGEAVLQPPEGARDGGLGAKAAETRARRIAAAVTKLTKLAA